MDLAVNLADTTSKLFTEKEGHPEPIKIAIIKMCPKILRINSKSICMGKTFKMYKLHQSLIGNEDFCSKLVNFNCRSKYDYSKGKGQMGKLDQIHYTKKD